ncbi:MAG: phosphatidylglycerol lysyltransferase domain-containing protein, partial [Marmoricola sp.]
MKHLTKTASPAWTIPSRRTSTARCRADERTRWFISRIVAVVGALALVSLLSTPFQRLMHGEFGADGVVGPLAAAASIGFWSLGLIMVARGLRHGHRLAWILTLSAVGGALWVHLARLNDPIDTGLLCWGAAWLVLRKEAFAVPVSRTESARALGMVAGAFCLVLSAPAIPPDFGDGVVATSLVGLALLVLVGALWAALSPKAVEQRTDLERHLERDRARRIVEEHGGGTLDYFALRDDKRWFFHAHSVVAYAVRFGVCLVSPDPIGPISERREVWAAFTDHARSHGWSVSILGASADWVGLYRSFGLHPVYLGDEAVVDCSSFTLEGRPMRGLRQACNWIGRAGYTVTFHDPASLDPATRRELLALSTMSRDGAVERGFSMTLSRLFEPEDTGLLL